MREDQYLKLQDLSEKLLDVFLEEADPDHWPGKGVKLGAMDAKTRGDLYWTRRTAASVLVLEAKITARIAVTQMTGDVTAAGDEDADSASQLDAEMARYERDALKVIDNMQGGKREKAIDRKSRGHP